MIVPGSAAPDFTLAGIDAQGQEQTYRLSELLEAGKPIILYTYPRDNTPGCTTEACDFRDRLPALDGRALVLGVSPDSLESHRKFQAKHGLAFPLLSDPEKTFMNAYGAWGEKKLYGKSSMGVIRSTFVIRPDGAFAKIFRNVKVKGHADAVLEALEALG